ncbi:hypothetical protein [Paenibacillus barengoltzii]|uniref:Uncharacterized protein n=1 Tax=Paenibacillus barengoltzii J12 TaxID=935846 RepID=A0ABY1M3L0_9BACL|nr:hypothetical protein [Paenibacillus barengoltzii]SMF69361.1 hypothetical protein SAMN02744124_04395 [Paenibacillus barengoltzii J12]
MNYHLKRAVSSFITKMILMIIVSYLGRTFFPDVSKFMLSVYFWLVYTIIVIGICYKEYKDFKDFSKHLDLIYETKNEELSYAKLEKFAVWSGTFAEISKTKLDILKAFSPIPIIIFILGVYTNNNSSINTKINIFSTELLLGDLLMYLGVGIPVFYFYFIYKSFSAYKKHMRRTMDYKAEAIVMKEKIRSLSKLINEDKDSA